MNVDQLQRLLDDTNISGQWLTNLGCVNLERGHSNLVEIAKFGITFDQLSCICQQIDTVADSLSDIDMALNNLEKFILSARNPLAIGGLFERDPTALPILLKIFSSSQHLSDLLIRDAESYDSLRLTEGQLYSREMLIDELNAAMSSARQHEQAVQILRRFKHRETLRIAFGDLIVQQRLEQVVQQISFLAETIIESALVYANRNLTEQWGTPKSTNGSRCEFVIFALGKLGGNELNYSSDIDLIAVFEEPGQTELGKSNQQFFEKLTRDTIKLLSEVSTLGAAYRVDMRLRPEGSRGPVCCHSASFLRYYELQGRTWERQALIKVRPVAGDVQFGEQLVKHLTHWIYRPILNRIDISGIKSLKRQIERRARLAGEEFSNIKAGHGGIRDIEFAIQFLQLLHGGSIVSVRTGNTLEAILRLAKESCLSQQEAILLNQNYCWLRRLEHLLQIMFDLQTHTLPDDEIELSKIAMRMGYRDCFGVSPLEQFQNDLREVTNVNRQILDHLLHNTFETGADQVTDGTKQELKASDLILQPDLSDDEASGLLETIGFRHQEETRRLIEALGKEPTIFLSSRRSRHFLAATVDELLEQICKTPNPDATLVTLSSVSEALGMKSALWELFSFNPIAMELFVRLCATSDYLSSIVRRNPGMIDELIDSLSMERLPTIQWLENSLDELTAGANEI
ncbi:MAG: bifunctional [glutamate--ammonia ligase]-adenylyl-L-tyrosine phosphorylase/[glutamate--ammonia-ligase] adenylyltransferase, partial [Planctomycetota bacterium]